ncbi:MAG: hypothetical protein QOH79_1604, partial [Acidimicrobiaceae bacterium]
MPSTFAELGAPADLVDHLASRGILTAFDIQTQALPPALSGRDICGRAPTGSGKTLAFGIPIAQRVHKAKPRRPKALILAPTRELATQISDELKPLLKLRGRTIATFFGGVSFGPQMSALHRGVDVAVACPGRLADLVRRNAISLDDVEIVVVDEADRMADMGFLPEVRRLLDRVKPNRQTLLFSATLDCDVDVLITRYQRNPVTHSVAVDEDAPKNRHIFWKMDRGERVDVAAKIVNAEWPAIVFCRTKHGADRLAKQLGRAGVSAAAIHGDRSQSQRERALAQFSSGKVQALIATDVAARGIHVDDVAAVVHFDPPGSEKDYVHRSGRTGRAGAAGLVVSLVSDDMQADANDLQRKLGFEPTLHAPDISALVGAGHDATPLVSVATASRPSSSPGRSGRARAQQ